MTRGLPVPEACRLARREMEALALGLAPAARRRAVADHVRACAACAAEQRAVTGIVHALRDLGVPEKPAGPVLRPVPALVGMAAAGLVLLLRTASVAPLPADPSPERRVAPESAALVVLRHMGPRAGLPEPGSAGRPALTALAVLAALDPNGTPTGAEDPLRDACDRLAAAVRSRGPADAGVVPGGRAEDRIVAEALLRAARRWPNRYGPALRWARREDGRHDGGSSLPQLVAWLRDSRLSGSAEPSVPASGTEVADALVLASAALAALPTPGRGDAQDD